MHLDRANAKFATHADAAEQWQRLGVSSPGRFQNVELYAPRAQGQRDGLVSDATSRPSTEVITYGWPPLDFIRQGLLRFCFAEDEDASTQVSFVEQRVRVQLARWAWPLAGEPGAAVLCQPDQGTSYVLSRVIEQRRDARPAGDGVPVRDFDDLIDFLTSRVSPDSAGLTIRRGLPGSRRERARRSCAACTRKDPGLGTSSAAVSRPVQLRRSITVVDIHGLHDSAQRFVVGALTSRIFEEKQGSGREPLRFIVLDELNKYAPRTGRSPIKEVLVDIAARGRSLGVLLIGAQQSAGDVDANIIRNAAVKVAGRLDAGESAEYRFLTPELRERAARFLPGTMVLDQPLIPAPIPLRFPFPAFATCVAESPPDPAEQARAEADALERL